MPPREYDWIAKELAESLETENAQRYAAATQNHWYSSYQIMQAYNAIIQKIVNTGVRIKIDAKDSEPWGPASRLSVYILQEYGAFTQALREYGGTRKINEARSLWTMVAFIEHDIIDVIHCSISMVGKKN